MAMGMVSQGSDGSSLAALLEVVKDPEAAKAKLAEFNAKIEEAKGFLEQAKNTNAENAQMVKDITEKTDAALRAQAEKEQNLMRRESAITKNLSIIETAKKELQVQTDKLSELQQNTSQKELAVAQAEKDGLAKVANMLAIAEHEVSVRKAAVESDYSARLAAAKKAMEAAIAKDKIASSILDEAEQKKQLYEKRLAAIQQVVQTMQGET